MGLWDGAAGGIASGGLGLIGGLISNDQNKHQAQKQMDFQMGMSNTAHQREVKDLIAAGLNPVLSANAGASTGQGAMATIENVAQPAIANALESAKLRKDISQTDSNILLNKAQGEAAAANALVGKANAAAVLAQIPAIKAESVARIKQATWDAKMSDYDNVSNRVLKGVQGASTIKDIINPFSSTKPKEGFDPNSKELKDFYKMQQRRLP